MLVKRRGGGWEELRERWGPREACSNRNGMHAAEKENKSLLFIAGHYFTLLQI